MNKVIRYILIAMLLFGASHIKAQDSENIETTIAADVVSQFIWRGQDLGNMSLQPTLGIGFKGLSLTSWGSVGITDSSDTKEIDLTLGYTTGGFNIGITDYWTNDGDDPKARYFRYNAHSTNHVFEANIGYDFGPVAIQWYTIFAGCDEVTEQGKRAYSSYVELNAPFNLASVDWEATLGIVPYATNYYNTTGFAVTNISLKAMKDIKITDKFSIPVFGQVVANPCSQKAYFVFGFTLQP